MNRKRRKLIAGVCFIIIGMTTATVLALKAFQENLLYFYSPTQVSAGEAPHNRPFRIGGMVVEGSLKRNMENLEVNFVLTDTLHNITVKYDGILPDLFREGQGIVANGNLREDGIFEAFEVLAKHDETYMPPEVAEAMAEAGKPVPVKTLENEK